MSISDHDCRQVKEVHSLITSPDPPTWSANLVRRINDLSDHTLIGALERGKALDFGLRSGKIKLTQESLDDAGLRLHIRQAKIYIELATHKSRCEEAAGYRDQRRYGTRGGEQAVVEKIRHLYLEENSYSAVARILNHEGTRPRKGQWDHRTVRFVLENAERGAERHPCACRMFRTDWVKPRNWSICWELLRLSDRTFEALLAAGGIHSDTTINDIRAFRKSRLSHPNYSLHPGTQPQERSGIAFLNQVLHGDCFELIPQLTDDSISVVITSPPYANQRDQYDGIPASEYPQRTVELMTAIRSKLKEDGSVLLVIRPHVEDGEVSDYVARTVRAIRDAGWVQPGELIWLKPDGGAMGAVERPRPNFEHILWFSKVKRPYVDLRACGQMSKRVGLEGSNRHDNIHGTSVPVDGIARIPDVFIANAGSVDRGIDHPAVYPPDLVRQLLLTFAPPGSVVLDPFAGSGTTCLVAQSEDYDFIGIDNGRSSETGELYADMANRRLQTEAKYARGRAKREREEDLIDANRP